MQVHDLVLVTRMSSKPTLTMLGLPRDSALYRPTQDLPGHGHAAVRRQQLASDRHACSSE